LTCLQLPKEFHSTQVSHAFRIFSPHDLIALASGPDAAMRWILVLHICTVQVMRPTPPSRPRQQPQTAITQRVTLPSAPTIRVTQSTPAPPAVPTSRITQSTPAPTKGEEIVFTIQLIEVDEIPLPGDHEQILATRRQWEEVEEATRDARTCANTHLAEDPVAPVHHRLWHAPDGEATVHFSSVRPDIGSVEEAIRKVEPGSREAAPFCDHWSRFFRVPE
jgi:hypothetical protein